MAVPCLSMESFLKAFFVLFLYFFKDDLWLLQKYVIMRKLKSLHFRKKVTTLSVSFLSNYSLMFIQVLSTLNASVSSNTLMIFLS